MIRSEKKQVIFEEMIEILDLPDSAYEKAKKRYEDLGEWFDRSESIVSENNPHIFPQGSFRLGTAIRPLDQNEEYDLDLACKLRSGVTKSSHSQEKLKELIKVELESYRIARGIQNKLEEKHRCWRLEYQDDLSFHMDIVPCIPEDEDKRRVIMESMRNSGMDDVISINASQTTVSITDDRHDNYPHITDDWKISNPEGYAKWFEYRMNPQETKIFLEKAQIDNVPLFRKKSPLQRVIQLLKRHRDNWSKDNPESKPISIIITTLAARAYDGETDIAEAMQNILRKMDRLVQPSRPRVPNPVDPDEDFADRWYREDCLHLKLEENFNSWLMQARVDFQHLTTSTDTKFLKEQIEDKFSLQVNESNLKQKLGITNVTLGSRTPKSHSIDQENSAKPWKS